MSTKSFGIECRGIRSPVPWSDGKGTPLPKNKLTVEDGVGDMLTALAGGDRKRGQWMSDLVKALHEQYTRSDKTDMDQLKLGFAGLTA